MKIQNIDLHYGMIVFVALAIPIQLTAQHTRHTVTDIGTLAGTFKLGRGFEQHPSTLTP
jgi:hypothetical protein